MRTRKELVLVRGRIRAAAGWALLVALLSAAGASAQYQGEFYVHTDQRFWWYQGDNRLFELLVPSQGEQYMERDVFGEKMLEITLRGGSPIIRVASFPGGSAALDRARQAVTGRWQHVLSNAQTTENRTITTSNGLQARFVVIQGRTPSGQTAMMRAVFFNNGDHNVYLQWLGLTSQYGGANQEFWLQAVNTFAWLR
ncbi:MAG TPA: hypothetical protein VKZ69_03280 [Limnochordales bacterium]|nr:hypothetical protein [Limnochordales bacterium]